ncbi:hypothetical protein ASPBRDRAFT_60428 [Aspergillus brasiliensis CBS 101740]|uniref:Major facilitator superfamily (MFS) profile domain-containing protein n=1 Tax=Aspergillus brasiliensis (strain CBS 101740 / IMI 381727 / IBT 21946) TaxID=767769 RepID=A0A1L9U1G5_ASPBC|nr:hypothetical protein ASPBRDRAFT_60428 [Aspergillus brasiliensis CBS 101740]
MSSSEVDSKYAWVIVLAVFWNNAHHWGILSSYGVFLAFFTSHSTFPGSRTLDYAFIGGLSASQALFISPIVTILNRSIGLKATMALGVLLETAAFLGASWSHQIWQLYPSQGVCFGWGLGMQYLSTTYLIPHWFSRHRSLAAGIATGGSGTGAPARSFHINPRLCTRYEMWLYLGWRFFSVMGFMVIWFSLARYGRSVGLSLSQGSIVTAVMNVGQMVGRPAVGFMSDAVGRINMATFATLVSGLLCLFLWTFARTYAALICFSFFAGLTIIWLVRSVPATFGEAIGLELRNSERHEFLHTQLFTDFLYVGAALCLAILRGWKIGQVRKREQHQEGITTACAFRSKYLDFVATTPKV